MQNVLCLHLHSSWASLFFCGNKPSNADLPERYARGTQFEYRTWHPEDRHDFGSGPPYKDIVITASNFYLGRDGEEDLNALAIGVCDFVAIEFLDEIGAEGHLSKYGFSAGVAYAWIAQNVRPFPKDWLIDLELRIGAARGFYRSDIPKRYDFSVLKRIEEFNEAERCALAAQHSLVLI